EKLREISNGDVVKATGLIKKRPERLINPKIPTGAIEMEITRVEILNPAAPSPIPRDTSGEEIDEDMRLKYRYLDLRRERMSRMLKLRSDYIYELRQILKQKEFIEVEAPILAK